jgi:hypothetical protein
MIKSPAIENRGAVRLSRPVKRIIEMRRSQLEKRVVCAE